MNLPSKTFVSFIKVVFLATLLASCAHLDQYNHVSEIQKSPNDTREYRAITLTNGLQAMLVSDPTADKAAASIDVYVGSSDDPEQLPGLAHFLEHMLFLGTEKYPEPDAYQSFISAHGGQHNAYTSAEHTNYFFEVNADHLNEALDRFSQQFTAPLFNAEYVEREVNAVHSEYSSKLKDDGRRYFSALKRAISQAHPYSKFSVGNLETLKDSEALSLRQALLAFYEKHYSANIMKLVILGKEDLDALENWAREKFSAIPNKNLKHSYVSQPFFKENDLPKVLYVEPVMDTRSMSIGFPMPSTNPYRDSQPDNYLANLLGHEGKGSLLSSLKDDGLVDSLSAGTHFDTQREAIFTISMSLTQTGLDQREDILERLFAYIHLIKEKGIQRTYFDEQATMLDIAFRFQEKSSAINYVRALSDALQEHEPETVLADSYRMTHYAPELYYSYLDYLNPDNMLVTVTAKSLETELETPWFRAPYAIKPLPQPTLNKLKAPKKFSELALPSENIFIPDNVALVSNKPLEDLPKLVLKEDGLELWHATDTSFGTPKTNRFVSIRSPLAQAGALELNQTELMVSLLKDALNEFSYPAYLAGLNYELYNHMRGITIKISGYSDKQDLLLTQIIKTLTDLKFDAERLEIMKERLMRSLINERDRKPYSQAIESAQQFLVDPSWSPQQRLERLEEITVNNLEDFRQRFFAAIDVAVLSHGNIDETSSIKTGQLISDMLLKRASPVTVERAKIRKLAPTSSLKILEVDHPDTGFVLYLQGQDKSFEERARYTVLSQLLSSAYYNDLRTQQQLGYVVFASHFPLLDVPGMAFIVQSPKATGPELLLKTEAFMAEQLAMLSESLGPELETAKLSVISRLEKQDTTAYERANRYWREVDRNNASFNTREELVSAIKALDTDSFKAFMQTVLQEHKSRLSVYTQQGSENSDTIAGYTPLESLPALTHFEN